MAAREDNPLPAILVRLCVSLRRAVRAADFCPSSLALDQPHLSAALLLARRRASRGVAPPTHPPALVLRLLLDWLTHLPSPLLPPSAAPLPTAPTPRAALALLLVTFRDLVSRGGMSLPFCSVLLSRSLLQSDLAAMPVLQQLVLYRPAALGPLIQRVPHNPFGELVAP